MVESKSGPTWGQIAAQPRYLAGLALAIVAAVIFSLLANWQWSRTLVPIPAPPQEFEIAPLDDLIQPGGLLPAELINRPVEFTAQLDFENAYIVAGRRQLASGSETIPGFWLVTNSFPSGSASSPGDSDSTTDDKETVSSSLTVAIYFSTELESLISLRDELAQLPIEALSARTLVGVLAAPEGPRPLQSPALASLSIAQLVNLYADTTLRSYPAVVILSPAGATDLTELLRAEGVSVPAELEPIQVRYLEEEFEINWLTAFYAVEWVIFAVIAFYIWWRLVSDARARAHAAARQQFGV